MTQKEVEYILQKQSRVFNFENELVLHFALSLIHDFNFDANDIYFEKTHQIQYHKQTTGLPHNEKESYFDLIAIKQGIRIGFEFKYCTSKFSFVDANKMKIDLKAQSANDIIRFGFRKDIFRLEQLIQKNEIDIGFAVLLTNVKNLIQTQLDNNLLDANYRFTNTIPQIDLGWNNADREETHWTKKGDKDYLLHLSKPYSIQWFRNSCQEHFFSFCVVTIV